MEHKESQDTSSFMPVIPRLDRLDRVLQLLEDKQRSSRKGFSAEESNKDSKTLSSALEEVQHKGTLIERLTALENRVLELSLEMEEGNTSKSSSSTVQASETTGKDDQSTIPKKQDENPVTSTRQEKQDPPNIQSQERSSSSDGFVRVMTTQHRCRQKKNTPKKWQRLFRLTC